MATTDKALAAAQQRIDARAAGALMKHPILRPAWMVKKPGAEAPVEVIVNPPQSQAEMLRLYPGAGIVPAP